jgi:hypothetical protein
VTPVAPVTPPATRPIAPTRTQPARTPKPKPARPAVPAPADTPVLVLNGNGVAGAAGREADRVKQLGYPVTDTRDAARRDYPQTVVMYRPTLRRAGLKLAHALSITLVQPLPASWLHEIGRAELVVITGRG